jgi:CheY-like chemotaxis protein
VMSNAIVLPSLAYNYLFSKELKPPQ